MPAFDDPVHGPWWYLSLSRFLRRILVISAAMALIFVGASEWLTEQWKNAPTRYSDGRLVYPDGRTVYPDGKVVMSAPTQSAGVR